MNIISNRKNTKPGIINVVNFETLFFFYQVKIYKTLRPNNTTYQYWNQAQRLPKTENNSVTGRDGQVSERNNGLSGNKCFKISTVGAVHQIQLNIYNLQESWSH